jgi:uncharacterized protein YdaU (DUF1376 family)
MHQQGRIKEETVRFVIGNYSTDLRNKFFVDQEGKWFNKRLEEETLKRNKYTESRRNNAKKKLAYANNMLEHMENENENENIDKDIVIIPFTDKFKIKWNEWIDYKRDQHKFKYKSIKTEQTSIDQLIKLSNNKEESAIEIINTSIANGWKGFFELKNNKNETNRLNSEQKFDAYKQYSSRFS